MAERALERLFGLIGADCVITQYVTTEAVFAAGEVIQRGRTRGTVRATGVTFDVPAGVGV